MVYVYIIIWHIMVERGRRKGVYFLFAFLRSIAFRLIYMVTIIYNKYHAGLQPVHSETLISSLELERAFTLLNVMCTVRAKDNNNLCFGRDCDRGVMCMYDM